MITLYPRSMTAMEPGAKGTFRAWVTSWLSPVETVPLGASPLRMILGKIADKARHGCCSRARGSSAATRRAYRSITGRALKPWAKMLMMTVTITAS
jgi:hypothetical protein